MERALPAGQQHKSSSRRSDAEEFSSRHRRTRVFPQPRATPATRRLAGQWRKCADNGRRFAGRCQAAVDPEETLIEHEAAGGKRSALEQAICT